METDSSPAPVTGAAWVYKRDGRLVPFEPDKISRALFAATEDLGRGDAFLARELTDAVLHFLTVEVEGAVPTTAQIADLVIKVVREMGHPRLAQSFADGARRRAGERQLATARPVPKEEILCRFSPQDSPEVVAPACLRAYSLQAVFSRDLAAAQADGLLTLTGLEAPLRLNACLLEPPFRPDSAGTWLEALEDIRLSTGRRVVLDGLDYCPSGEGPTGSRRATDCVRELALGLRAVGREAVVNLNTATPPPWAGQLAEGPLFAGHRSALDSEERSARALALLEHLLAAEPSKGRIRVDWHLGEVDLGQDAAGRLVRLARLALETDALAFTFDRPRKPVSLAEGIDRRHPAVLQSVGLHLPQLAKLPGVAQDPELFLQKLGSLVRLALSAGARKREFLRRHHAEGSPLQRGFLLDRARLVVVPVGLGAVVRLLTGAEVGVSRPALDLARRIVQRLREVLRQDGPTYQLDACLDGARDFLLAEQAGDLSQDAGSAAGLTPWEPALSMKQQLRIAGVLHAAAEAGTTAVLLPADQELSGEEAADLLRFAGGQTDVVRLRFVRLSREQRQLW